MTSEYKSFPWTTWRKGLFLCNTGEFVEQSMIFYLENPKDDEIKQSILNQGGNFVESFRDDPHTIILTSRPIQENSYYDCFDVKFLKDSVRDAVLKDLNEYRVCRSGVSLFEPYDANLVLNRQLKWSEVRLKNNKTVFSKYVHISKLPDAISGMGKLYKDAENCINPLIKIDINHNWDIQFHGVIERSAVIEKSDEDYHEILASNVNFLEAIRWISHQAGGRDVNIVIDPKEEKTWGMPSSTFYNCQSFLICNLILGISICLKEKKEKQKEGILTKCYMCRQDLEFDGEIGYDTLLMHSKKHILDTASDHKLMFLINGIGEKDNDGYSHMFRESWISYNDLLMKTKWSESTKHHISNMTTPPHS